MYVLALLVALGMAKFIVKRDNMQISNSLLDNYFFWVEIGGYWARGLATSLFTIPIRRLLSHASLADFTHFHNSEFVGIRGMSYHGAVVGF